MNKTTLTTLSICVGLPLLLWFLTFISNPSAKDVWSVLGLIFLVLAFLYLLPGFILVLVKNERSRDIGKGMLLSVALLMLVGFSVCSANPVSFH